MEESLRIGRWVFSALLGAVSETRGGPAALYALGYRAGLLFAKVFGLEGIDPVEALREALKVASRSGFFRGYRVITVDTARRRAVIEIWGSVEVDYWRGRAQGLVCNFTRGVLAGGASAVLDEPMSCRELECEAAGGKLCRFIIASSRFGSPRREVIVEYLAFNPGVGARRVARDLGISYSSARWHLERLVRLGVVEERREGRARRFYLACSRRGS